MNKRKLLKIGASSTIPVTWTHWAGVLNASLPVLVVIFVFCSWSMGCAFNASASHSNKGETTMAGSAQAPSDISGSKDWAEPDDLVEAKRMEWRPGNFAAMGALVGYLNGVYEIRPVLRNVTFPIIVNGTLYREEAQFEDSLKRIESKCNESSSPQNKLRSYVIHLQQLTFVNLESGDDTLESQTIEGLDEYVFEYIRKARSFHAGKAVLIRAKIRSESLQSPKIEGGEPNAFEWFLVVQDRSGGWYVCMHIW